MEHNNVMIDLETLGTTPNSAILCVAAVKFSIDKDGVDTFQANVSQKSCENLGLVIDQDTLDWWKKPERVDLFKAFFKNTHPIQDVLTQLSEFIGPDAKHMYIWANGTVFDIGMLEWSYRVAKVPCPWRYYNIMDARTIYRASNLDFKSYPRVGEYHNAIDDCLTQIKALKDCLCD